MPKKKTALTIEERLQQALVPAEEQPYEVPENWVWVRLGAVCGFERGITFPSSAKQNERDDENIPCLRTANVQDELELNDLIYVNKKYYKNNSDKLIRENDIIMSTANSRELVGKTSFVYKVDYPMIFGGFVMALRANKLLSKFLFYYLRLEFLLGRFRGESTQTTNIANISSSVLGEYIFPLPPLSEQQRIVERIGELLAKLDEAKERLQEVADSFAVRKAAILHKAFTGELTKQWRRENGVSDESWEESNLGSFIACGPQNGLYKPKSSYGDGIRIIRIDAFYDGVIEQWDELKRLRLDENEIKCYSLNLNDILINRVNSMQYLGKSALVRELKDACVFESNIMRLSVDESRIYPEFLISFLNSQMGLNELRKNAKQAVNQASINQQDIKNVIINLPSLPEQHEIVRLIDDLLARERAAQQTAEQALASIDLMKKSILARAFRGELGTNKASEVSALELLRQVLAEN
ncbi:restriction endonuclease subunit S [uncultured Phascolarctobacterium sp.]|uniref:restriction endonuclease subunit S n=1 Tax=uncultured Phascolarctobacterium sp. TaxID=512296 RepID=UPI0027DC9345|nr:restriction endonuclease subunit S [uncultured Phascolarctobacterium sp.]